MNANQNNVQELVIDVWWMQVAVTIDESTHGAAPSGSRPAQAV